MLLAAFCLLSERTVSQALTDLDNNQLVTIQLLPEDQVRSQIIGSVQLAQSITPPQVISPLNFFHLATQSNSLISALNTNLFVGTYISGDQLPYVYTIPTAYRNKSTSHSNNWFSFCGIINEVAPAGFYPLMSYYESASNHRTWPDNPPLSEPIASAMVSGFFGGCTPLDAVLETTLDCLYNITCLEVFTDYFPALNQVCEIHSLFSHKTSLHLDKLHLDQSSFTFKPAESFFE